MSRTKNALKMVLTNIVSQLVVIIAGLILPPLIIKHYGSTVNGLVNSVKQILNYFQVASVGMGAAAQVALYQPLARKDENRINQIISEMSSFFNKIGILFCGVVGIIAFALPVIRNDGLPKTTIFLIVIICASGSIIEFSVLTKYKTLLTADQRQYISTRVSTEGTIINTVFSIILIYLNASIIWVQLVATFAYVIRMILLINKIKKLYPFLDLKYRSNQKTINNQKDALLYKLTDIIINYIPMTIVMLICGYNDVSVYTVYNLVFSAIVMTVNIFSSGFASAFGNQIAENDYNALKSSYRGYNFVYRTISYWLYTCSNILIVPFVSVYITNTDGVNYLIPSLGICFTLNGLFRSYRTPAITIIDATGRFKENLIFNYGEAILNIVLSVILTVKFGMIGVLIGGLVSALIRSILFIHMVDTKIIKRNFCIDLFYIVINLAVSIFSYIMLNDISVNNYFEWFIKAVMVALINGLAFVLLNILIDKVGFKEFYKRLKGLLKIK